MTVLDRHPPERDGCSFGNAGMVVPSHFIPLAAPGMVALGLKWMRHPESPVLHQTAPGPGFVELGLEVLARRERRPCPARRPAAAGSGPGQPGLLTRSWPRLPGDEFGLVKKGLLMLCKTQHALEEEAQTAEQARALGVPAEVLDAAADRRAGSRACAWTLPARSIFHEGLPPVARPVHGGA